MARLKTAGHVPSASGAAHRPRDVPCLSRRRMKPAAAGLTGIAVLAFISLGLPDGVLGVAWPSMRGALGLGMAELGGLLGRPGRRHAVGRAPRARPPRWVRPWRARRCG